MDMLSDVLPDTPPDFGPQLQAEFSVDEVRLGDGYVARAEAGINSSRQRRQVAWQMLSREEFDPLYAFLEQRRGVWPFWWEAPWDTRLRKWVCTELSSQVPTSARFATIRATFVEDHNP